MNRTTLLRRAAVASTLAAAGLFAAAGSAQARDHGPDVRWSLSLGGPGVAVTIGNGGYPVYPALPAYPAYSAYPPAAAVVPGYAVPSPVYYVVDGPVRYRYAPGHRARDRDRDGIPDRWDRRYTPPWDRDGDGVPNRHDRHPGRADRSDRGWR
jgi:hypothetical protein